ncbi:MAG: hypothetical protein DWQ34_27440 [Planctomycetota bacterium]|nr:MAG: hypothetical protein DWQ34_27440 [Planctomycetota bacterium]REK20266.1 MAG: hypothetical protein DWQ41_25830 [Planctomycetota bacterium]
MIGRGRRFFKLIEVEPVDPRDRECGDQHLSGDDGQPESSRGSRSLLGQTAAFLQQPGCDHEPRHQDDPEPRRFPHVLPGKPQQPPDRQHRDDERQVTPASQRLNHPRDCKHRQRRSRSERKFERIDEQPLPGGAHIVIVEQGVILQVPPPDCEQIQIAERPQDQQRPEKPASATDETTHALPHSQTARVFVPAGIGVEQSPESDDRGSWQEGQTAHHPPR